MRDELRAALDPSAVRLGRARGRYFRENFAQGGVDLVQIIPELVTNADAAIAASGRTSGGSCLTVAAPDAEFLSAWRARMRALRSPALLSWKHELRCTDDGEGVDADADRPAAGRARGRAAAARGSAACSAAACGTCGWRRAPGGSRASAAGRAVESWFFPAPGDEPYAFVHVRDEPATDADLKALGVAVSGTRVTVPLARRGCRRRAGCGRSSPSSCSCGRSSRTPTARCTSSSRGRPRS